MADEYTGFKQPPASAHKNRGLRDVRINVLEEENKDFKAQIESHCAYCHTKVAQQHTKSCPFYHKGKEPEIKEAE